MANMVFNFRCVDVFTSADGRREYRLAVIVEQTAPVLFRIGKRYDFVEAGPEAGAKSQLEPADREAQFMAWLEAQTPDDLDRMSTAISEIYATRSKAAKK